MCRLVRGLIFARDVRASLRHHIVQTLALDRRPLIQSLLSLYPNLKKLHAGAFRRVGETSGSPAADKSDAQCEYPLYVRYHLISCPAESRDVFDLELPRLLAVVQFPASGSMVTFVSACGERDMARSRDASISSHRSRPYMRSGDFAQFPKSGA